MENNFEQLITTLQTSSSYHDVLCEIKHVLEKQNSQLLSSFISQFYQSFLILKHWVWQLFSQDTHSWIEEPNCLELLRTLALFNKNLIFNYEDIEAKTKASLLIPETVDIINVIFEKIEKTNDENHPFISIVSLWYNNLAEFLHANLEFQMCTIIIYINHYMARNYVMTDRYKFYLNQLHQSPLSQSIFTAKQLFYIKTCSLSLSLYLFVKTQDFPYTPEELIQHFGADITQIILLHTYTIELWSTELLSCITHLMFLFTTCCWWGGEKGSRGKIVFPTESAACEYIDALIRIIDYTPLYQSITIKRTNDETILLETTLFTILNIAQKEQFTWFLRSKISLQNTLLTLATRSLCDKIRLSIYAILGEILCDKSLKELKIFDSASSFFFNMLEHAWQNPSKKFQQVPIGFLLKCLANFSKIDAFQQQIADTNKVLLLIEMCDQYPIVYDILWALSFNHDIQQQLHSNTSFITKLAHLPKEYDNQIRKSAHGILWNLEINHENRITSAISNEKTFDIMISYSHKDEIICKQIYNELINRGYRVWIDFDQMHGNVMDAMAEAIEQSNAVIICMSEEYRRNEIICKQIYDELINSGYRVWIDFDQMHGNVMDAMAEAIEQSNAVIICMSEEYRRSSYCRAEANYAFKRRVKIVPILLQQHYRPDGWLLFLIGQLLYIDFTKYEFSQAMKMLIKELKISVISEMCLVNVDPKVEVDTTIPITPISPEAPSMLKPPTDILNWNQTHVHDWLISHGLLQMSRLFANFNGRSLMYMNEIIENVELEKVISLLQADSLRRTSQTLSLVELSHLRSLLNQQKQSSPSTIIAKPAKVKVGKLKRKSSFCCQII
ncbi:unnamed protein product [Rotaria sp. Silwood1]|nr:unnamed protein product [Rotaria sp. Silwood1]